MISTPSATAQVTPSPQPIQWRRPAEGAVITPYSEDFVYFPALDLWQIHPAIDFLASAGDGVYALAEGRVERSQEGLILRHSNGYWSLYRGIKTWHVRENQWVQAGAYLGDAGGRIPGEGDGEHICVRLEGPEGPVDYSSRLDEKE